MTFQPFAMFMGVIGIIFSIFSGVCAGGHVQDNKDTKLFGKIPYVIIGIIGYTLIILTSALGMPITTHLLIYFAALFTIYLAHKGLKIKLGCPLCPVLWIFNLFFLVISFNLP